MSELQLELATVIDHTKEPGIRRIHSATHGPAGLRLAKMVTHYEDYPSSDAWRDMQRLAREMQK